MLNITFEFVHHRNLCMNRYPFLFRTNTGLVFQDAAAKIDIKNPTGKAFRIKFHRKGLRKGLRSENMLRNI